MLDKALYVTYFVATQQRGGFRQIDGIIHLDTQKLVLDEFMQGKVDATVFAAYVETPDSRRTSRWPELIRALDACKQSGATLVIAELGTLPSNEAFAETILEANIKFYCCDQPEVDAKILKALSQHAQVQRKLHGKLIREGLKMTSAKSGNPNAAEVISKVNKPKIDTAIVFAFLLQPIITDYRRKGYSQRQMVKNLNEEGFTAPEGGKWVLSQLQKVLDRVRMNEVTMELKSVVTELVAGGLDNKAIADTLNSRNIPSIKRNTWDETQVKKIRERLEQIEDIVRINKFVLTLLPVLQQYRTQGLGEREIILEFAQAGIPIKREAA